MKKLFAPFLFLLLVAGLIGNFFYQKHAAAAKASPLPTAHGKK